MLERWLRDCKRAWAAGLAATALVAATPAGAALLDDALDHGYRIVAATTLPGAFNGCVRQHRLVIN